MYKPLRENIIDLYPIPVSEQVIPRVYQGKTISQVDSLSLTANGRKLRRHNTPGLIYGKFQVPKSSNGNNKKGWDTILSSPTSDSMFRESSLFKIVIRKHPKIKSSPILGVILVHFLRPDAVPLTVRKASSHYLYHHTNVRNIQFEHGVMVPVGKRVDIRTSSLSNYVPTHKNKVITDKLGMTERQLHLSLRDFNQLFYDSSP